jgi:hypothetical protein
MLQTFVISLSYKGDYKLALGMLSASLQFHTQPYYRLYQSVLPIGFKYVKKASSIKH